MLIEQVQHDLEKGFVCKHEEELIEYMGSKITINRDSKGLGTIKLMQPVLERKLMEEYKPSDGPASKTPAVAGQVLSLKDDGDGTVLDANAKTNQLATATNMYMLQRSCPDIFNTVRRLARHMTVPREAHVQALMTLIRYVVSTVNRGLVLASKEMGSPEYKFKVHGQSDSDYAMNPDDCRSISDARVFVNGAPKSFHGVTQKIVTLSVTKADIVVGVMVSQDMLYVYRLLELLELKVELPILLEMDNSGAVDVVNSRSVDSRTHHVYVCNYFLCKLKDQGLLYCQAYFLREY